MPTSPLARYPGLDTLRAVAIGSVMIFHLLPVLPPALEVFGRFGWMGVDLFFVMSGYLIGSQLLRPLACGLPVGVVMFYRRRAYRILPAYLAVVALYLFVPVWRERPVLAPAWELLTFTYNLLMNYPKELAFSHSWSLCIEEHFYLLLPLMVLWLARRPSVRKTGLVFAGILMVGLIVRWWELSHVVLADGAEDRAWILMMKRIYYPTYSRLDGLLCGVALATVRSFRPAWWRYGSERGTTLLLLGAALLAAGWWTFGFDYPSPDRAVGQVLGFPLISTGFALWVAAATAERGLLRMRVPGAQLVATLAFSLYLTHKGTAQVAGVWVPWLSGNRSWAAAGTYCIACLGVAATLYGCVERPFLNLRQRSSTRHPSPDVTARLDPGI